MSRARSDALISQWSERFRRDALAAGVVLALRERSDEIWQHAFELLKRESPEYRNAVDEEFTQESKAHCNELLRMIVAIAAAKVKQSGADPFDFVRTHAAWRARHQVPLIASLHAYRLAHRTYSEITRDALLRHGKTEAVIHSLTMLSDFWIQLFDHVGAVLAEAHAVEDGLIVAQGTRSYASLIDDLLRGIEPKDAEAQRLCGVCGIRSGAPIAIAVVRPQQPVNGGHVDDEVTLRSFVRLVDQMLPPAVFGRLVDIRNNEVTAVVCSESGTARAVLQTLRRSGFAKRAGNGHAARVGLSSDVVDIPQIPRAVDEARIALEFANAARPLMHFSDIDLPEFLIRRADVHAARLIPDWVRHFDPAKDDQSRELMRTIRIFADCSLNVKQTAQRLNVHTNTVYFRLNRIDKLSGVDPRTYSGISTLLTAVRFLEIHGGSRNGTARNAEGAAGIRRRLGRYGGSLRDIV
jgi:hypothetical protein